MASANRSASDPLSGARPAWLARLLAEPSAYDPFVVVGLLEQLTSTAARIGGDGPVADEALRFAHARALSFAPGDLAEVHELGEETDSGPRFEIVASFLGLTGTGSPLPTYLTREAARPDEHGRAKAEFLDLFHHRLHSLLYRGVRKLDWSSEHAGEGLDPWAARVLALLGLDVYERAPLRHLRPVELLRVAPLLLSRARGPETLARILTELLGDQLAGARVEVRSFVGAWVAIADEQRIRLGLACSRLGIETVIGERCLDRAGKAEIAIGPVDQDGLRRFSAGGSGVARVRELLDLICEGPVELELELELGREDQVPAVLGRSRLGDDAWLARREGEGVDDRGARARVRLDDPGSAAPARVQA